MVIEGNGLKIETREEGRVLYFKIVEQSKSATNAFRFLSQVEDQETGYSLKSNKHPNFSGSKKRFYVRGSDSKKDHHEAVAEFGSVAEMNRALEALQRMVKKVKLPEPENNEDLVVYGNAQIHRGGTTHFRFAFINFDMAKVLQLTGHPLYPKEVIDWTPCSSMVIGNPHWDEHANQMCDVLNKAASSKKTPVGYVTNPHRVTPEQAKMAKEGVQNLFKDAYKNDHLVATWRIVTGLRAPDFDYTQDEIVGAVKMASSGMTDAQKQSFLRKIEQILR